MAQAQIDNSIVSAQLNNGETVSVPTGETWKVWVTVAPDAGSGNNTYVTLNGDNIYGHQTSNDNHSQPECFTVVATAGDTFGFSTTQTDGCHIGGFVL